MTVQLQSTAKVSPLDFNTVKETILSWSPLDIIQLVHDLLGELLRSQPDQQGIDFSWRSLLYQAATLYEPNTSEPFVVTQPLSDHPTQIPVVDPTLNPQSSEEIDQILQQIGVYGIGADLSDPDEEFAEYLKLI